MLQKTKLVSIVFLISLLCISYASAEMLSGHVLSVHDGDTVTLLLPNDEQIKVRLAQIDAPELDPVSFWSGGRTKMNRIKQGYDKDHFIDAACVGETGADIYIPPTMKPLIMIAKGRGNRQMCRVNKYGFPRAKAKTVKQVDGFMTGDIVRLIQPKGTYKGVWRGCVSIRARKQFDITVKVAGKSTKISGVSKNFTRLQGFDGYTYG